MKIDDIFKTLEHTKTNQTFYSNQALSRVLYEHYLVTYFIWTKCRVDKNDECGTDYSQTYFVSEMFKQESFNYGLDKNYNAKDFLSTFLSKKPEFNSPINPLTAQDISDVHTKAKKFDIRIILKYLRDELNSNDEFYNLHSFVLDVCKQYNKLSSYVHGGRAAELEVFENTPPINKKETFDRNVGIAEVFSYQILDFIMMILLEEDKSFYSIYKPVHDFSKSSVK